MDSGLDSSFSMFEPPTKQMPMPFDAKFDKLVPKEFVAENSTKRKCESGFNNRTFIILEI
jgi:hypothetical protein